MVLHKSNTVRNSGVLSVLGASGGFNYRVFSINIPKECDEIRFQLFNNSQKNTFAYSFDDAFNIEEVTPTTVQSSLSLWQLPFVNGENSFLLSDNDFGYSQQIIIRKPSDFGETIYFMATNIGSSGGTWGVQWQIIGGCNPNGY